MLQALLKGTSLLITDKNNNKDQTSNRNIAGKQDKSHNPKSLMTQGVNSKEDSLLFIFKHVF